ncbi:hypothetical protein Acsp04_62030 [Actinomadura sp. NBRC 104425]|uniref:Zn-ribbon domain-containing OB-fold protein n=1 Tax=Actinomadura sp. NBRC 104425 TaxID=3032204 RepID=UPI0024A35C29|nr:zinc ribbon domain-containing protein [Actinomadura sp. NBRC 104425]GLZ15968.1 hypothetical protein Acsp04_62030 [Actinomadura sp. NBRC 104425]
MPQQIPVVDYLELGDRPHLRARECTACGALYFDRRNACAKCFGTEFTARALSNHGRLRAFTFVHRVKRPFVSAIVELDGGGVVKANLLGVEDPEQITPRLPVVLETYAVGTDDEGTEAIAFGYRPQGGEK